MVSMEKLDKDTYPMVQTYRTAILCEMLRADIFAGRQTPLIFGEPPAWMAWMVESLKLLAEERYDQAEALRDQAFEKAEAIPGVIDENSFNWIADADSRLGPILEVILNGRYYWVPFQQIQSVQIAPPKDLRDLVWLPAQFFWINGSKMVGFIPSRYPGSEKTEDSALQLAHTTFWQEVNPGIHYGLGQRMLATDLDDYSLLNVRLLRMNPDG